MGDQKKKEIEISHILEEKDQSFFAIEVGLIGLPFNYIQGAVSIMGNKILF